MAEAAQKKKPKQQTAANRSKQNKKKKKRRKSAKTSKKSTGPSWDDRGEEHAVTQSVSVVHIDPGGIARVTLKNEGAAVLMSPRFRIRPATGLWLEGAEVGNTFKLGAGETIELRIRLTRSNYKKLKNFLDISVSSGPSLSIDIVANDKATGHGLSVPADRPQEKKKTLKEALSGDGANAFSKAEGEARRVREVPHGPVYDVGEEIDHIRDDIVTLFNLRLAGLEYLKDSLELKDPRTTNDALISAAVSSALTFAAGWIAGLVAESAKLVVRAALDNKKLSKAGGVVAYAAVAGLKDVIKKLTKQGIDIFGAPSEDAALAQFMTMQRGSLEHARDKGRKGLLGFRSELKQHRDAPTILHAMRAGLSTPNAKGIQFVESLKQWNNLRFGLAKTPKNGRANHAGRSGYIEVKLYRDRHFSDGALKVEQSKWLGVNRATHHGLVVSCLPETTLGDLGVAYRVVIGQRVFERVPTERSISFGKSTDRLALVDMWSDGTGNPRMYGDPSVAAAAQWFTGVLENLTLGELQLSKNSVPGASATTKEKK